MAKANNIINFNVDDSRDTYSSVQIPELLKSAKRITNDSLKTLLDNMFNNVDDCLFEYADKAENNQQQSVYFDAMREIRIKKSAMLDTFYKEFDTQFSLSFKSNRNAGRQLISSLQSEQGLSLVEDEDLEESLAVTNMVNRIYAECREALSAMVQRINAVYEEAEFSKESNPLSPNIICDAFSVSVESLDSSLEIKLIVYKLFDKYVVHNIALLYNEINDMFIAAGVLPTIKYKIPVVNNVLASRKSDYIEQEVLPEMQDGIAEQRTVENGGAVDVFASMRELLTQYRGSEGVAAGGNQHTNSESGTATVNPTHSTAMTGASSNTTALGTSDGYYVMQDVVGGLSQLQSKVDAELLTNRDANSGEIIKSHLVQAMNSLHAGSDQKSMNHVESDTIDIVSMMFDFILDDKTLPERIKAVIARLQIPMVKVAMLDKSFFSKKTHPARQLLNELAYASNTLGSDFDTDDSLFEEVSGIVERVLNEFDNNVELFEELLEEFCDFLQKEIEANKMAEDMIIHVKETVAEELEKRVVNKNLPDCIVSFLMGPWKEVLKIIGVRDGCEGMAWSTAVNLVDDLAWSVQPKIVVKERQQLTILIPKILQALQEGLTLICYEQEEINDFFDELEKLHLDTIRMDVMTRNAMGSSNQQIHSPTADSTIERSEDSIVDDVVLQSDKHDSYQFDVSDPELMCSEFYHFVNNMPLGTWVEFKLQNGIKRGKLTWKCDFTGEYTFMDRMYKVIADISMRELITCLEEGRAQIADDIPLFDKAVDAVIKGMKSYMSTKGSNTQQVLN